MLVIPKDEIKRMASEYDASDVVVVFRRPSIESLRKLSMLGLNADHARYKTGGVVRLADAHRYMRDKFWLMSDRDKGWSSQGIPYNSLEKLMRENAIVLVGIGRDAVSPYYEFRPAAEGERK